MTCKERPTDKLLSYYSDWLQLRVGVAWIMKVKDASRLLVQKRKDSKDDRKYQRATRINTRSIRTSMKELITVDDLKGAENAILTYVQRQSFPQEISMLQGGASCVKEGSSIYDAGWWHSQSGWASEEIGDARGKETPCHSG